MGVVRGKEMLKISYFDKEKKLPGKKNSILLKPTEMLIRNLVLNERQALSLLTRSLPWFEFPLLIIDRLKGHALTWRVENVRHFFFEPIPFVFIQTAFHWSSLTMTQEICSHTFID